ncbi:hypothetical protein SAY86_029166 [Trapa natans]|uniref:SHSP domain-containing protein n=1 Tax=Trapa natans TaxID=22666 RepID=A0AAN7MGK2_TRANT|nr:hypothetical protein SAY86_029166 [Trapa natans]
MQGKKERIVDFEPLVKWDKGEESDTIELHVGGFRKGQLRVQVNNLGTLLVTGERQLEDKISWSRFRREFKLEKEYCLHSIRAKLGNGVLHIVVPRKLEAKSPIRLVNSQQAVPAEKTEPADRKENNHQPLAGVNHQPGEPDQTGTGSYERERVWMNGACWRLQFVSRRRVLQISVAVLAAAVTGTGIYLVSKYLLDHRNGLIMPGPTQYTTAIQQN